MTVKLELDLRTDSNSLTSAVMQYDGLLVVCGQGNSKFANLINVLLWFNLSHFYFRNHKSSYNETRPT